MEGHQETVESARAGARGFRTTGPLGCGGWRSWYDDSQGQGAHSTSLRPMQALDIFHRFREAEQKHKPFPLSRR